MSPPDISVDLMELRAYVEGVQTLCCFGEQPVQMSSTALLQLFAPVATRLQVIEERLTATA